MLMSSIRQLRSCQNVRKEWLRDKFKKCQTRIFLLSVVLFIHPDCLHIVYLHSVNTIFVNIVMSLKRKKNWEIAIDKRFWHSCCLNFHLNTKFIIFPKQQLQSFLCLLMYSGDASDLSCIFFPYCYLMVYKYLLLFVRHWRFRNPVL